ncbi:hypothetical protein A1Q2_03295 [Trichosporon asahii var. asahii CBS 8904]|uniref:Uncharacterized protein n=2 Tax=Trichosporon asahii var. asahii TaxID=189963 RepID=K1VZZ8_TRIAC|nr:hypothetical protein A1Q1_06650 [Trichosporon asahii var. asahii CBS 2479]EJT52112.1 hypothetical protein A1Q1_06650 [Trichosporon asahii var. asahii CBS 2479]EKD02403.1 hypothetical protein A1Q2_03295 [Trichosporon asahii var. asahii CBS 8904]
MLRTIIVEGACQCLEDVLEHPSKAVGAFNDLLTLGEVRRIIDEDEVEDEEEERKEHTGYGVGKLVPTNPDAPNALQPLESAVPLRPWSDEKDDGQQEEGTTGSFSNAEPAAPRAPQFVMRAKAVARTYRTSGLLYRS